ncbi:UDP-2,3-diacylglucosamine diphosphatase [Campylobacter concisus]|uniref:UDP-2,3-diacylglucosamine diphosphatase n=1 Tax=Campylobacter concisus TaxID=199 RepID=UPI0018AB325B|nr:UDP-2,3-diacylglucosamine diphosphatase [Campylobacter concisus]QPH99860.1 UDP-2,3-diacylglucosamine diphosphatase [Campylobacter concisus]QPI01652.1 UDP-2,3-diacylglucosamine diphosphatase [Campylobacter concisus]
MSEYLYVPVIKEGAIFIADAHENVNRNGFLKFLRAVDSGEIKEPPQIFLLGDMFDFLTGEGEYTIEFYTEHLRLINKISQKVEIFYFEGNHDFRLSNLFNKTREIWDGHEMLRYKSIRVYDIYDQPANFKTINEEHVQIAHGDIFLPFVDKYALRFLRVKWFLKFMNALDKFLNFKISKAILARLTKKNLDYKIPNFKELMGKHLQGYEANIVIEGHYHQGEQFNIYDKFYINLPYFACEQSYFVVEYAQQKLNLLKMSLKGH